MERLTAKHRAPRGAIPGKFSIDFIFHMPDDEVAGFFETINRLADYEDTGLEPQEIAVLKLYTMGMAVAEIEEFDGVPTARLQELAKAEKEGRLVILPAPAEEGRE